MVLGKVGDFDLSER